jgi:hypothetical protein
MGELGATKEARRVTISRIMDQHQRSIRQHQIAFDADAIDK